MEQTINPRIWLAKKFAEQKQQNRNFSLRAFAKYVDLPAATVSQILNGKRQLTFRSACKFADKLCRSPEERQIFLQSLMDSSKTSLDRRFQEIDFETYAVIKEWYHFAILSMSKLKESSSDHTWIAQRLGIDMRAAKLAVERLVRLKLLDTADGKLTQTDRDLATTSDIPSEAIKQAHKSYLELADEAIDKIPVEDRDMSCITLAVTKDQLPVAKSMIKAFRRHFAEANECQKGDEVYVLNICFFPITKPIKEDLT